MHWLKKNSILPILHSSTNAVKTVWHVVKGIFPLTWLSIILIAIIYYVWFWEVSAHANQILFSAVIIWIIAFASILFFTILSALLVVGITHHTNRALTLDSKTEVGSRIQTNYRIYVPFWLPFVTTQIELLDSTFQRHEKKAFSWSSEYLIATERGRINKLHRKVTVKDIFGLTAISFVLTQDVSLVLEPAKSNYEMLAFQTKTSGDGYSHPEGDPRGELVEMRRYQAGDPLRLVLWKVFARSRKLVVRAPEPAIVEEKDMFVYFVSGQNDEASASMARSFLNGIGLEMSKELSFAADGAKRLVSNEQEGLNDVIDSVTHRSRGGEDLLSVARLVAPGAMAHCFLLVPQKLGNWLEQVKTFIATFKVHPTFIVSVDAKTKPTATSPKKIGKLKKLLCSPDENDANDDKKQFNNLCSELSSLGTVRIVDISTGAMTEYTGGSN